MPSVKVLCHCGHTIRLKGRYEEVEDLRGHTPDPSKEGRWRDFLELHCPHCGKTVYLPYTWAFPRTWGPWGTVAILSAFILGSVALMVLLQQAGASVGAVIWIPIVALAFYVQIAKMESDGVERFEHSKHNAPTPRLTPEVAATWGDIDLLAWYNIEEPEDITNLCEQVIYYATVLHYETYPPTPLKRGGPRYMEWFYYYESNYNPHSDDGIDLYSSLMAVGAIRHAAIVEEAREIYLQHRDEVERCVKSATQDGYQLLLSLNLFEAQDDALAQAYRSEPLMPLVAQYIREHIEELESGDRTLD